MNFKLTKEFIDDLEILIINKKVNTIKTLFCELLAPDVAEIITILNHYIALDLVI